MRAPNPNFSDATLASNSMTAHSARILIRLTVLPLCLALSLSLQAQDSNQLDWSPIEAVPEALRDAQCERCEGRYIDPLADVDTSAPPEGQEIQGTGSGLTVDPGLSFPVNASILMPEQTDIGVLVLIERVGGGNDHVTGIEE